MKYVIEELLNLDKPRSKQISPRFANQYNNLKKRIKSHIYG
jgi:hypothetical protein